MKRAILSTLIAGALLASCGSDGPPEQAPAELPTLSGTATYDAHVSPGPVTAKGVAGQFRTASNSSGTNQYSVSLTQLTAPYVLKWSGVNSRDQQVDLYSLARQPGIANITPLTTLLAAQLFGQDPVMAYAAFGSTGGVQTGLVTDVNITDAQAKVTAYLQDVLGVSVRSGTASFLTSPFKATAGDAMFDTMQALDAKLIVDGTTLPALAIKVAALARLCIEEKILVTVDGQQKEFCPATKSATPVEGDNDTLDYIFMNPANDTLTVRVREDSVLSGTYATAAGATYTCSGIACGAIALGLPRDDLTRSLTFTNTELTGGTSNVLLNGTLMGAIPGLSLPVLPCDHNKFFVILTDRTVIADCVDASDPLGLGGTISETRGAIPSRAIYRFVNSSSANAGFPQVELVTDANDSVVSVYFKQTDPQTGEPALEFACEESACNGIALGPVTVNTDLGPDTPVLIRRVTFDNTILSGLNADGSPTGTSATLKATFTTVYYVDPSFRPEFPPLTSCAPGSDAIAAEVLSGPFNYCSSAGNRSANTLAGGTLVLSMNDDQVFSPIDIVIQDGSVVSIAYNSPVFQLFRCSNDCAGVTVSAPDALGNHTITFEDTVLYEDQSFPLPGPRTVVLNSGAILFPPPP